MDQVADVDIEPDGVYKYILIKVSDKKSSASKVVVRGYSWADYHGEGARATGGSVCMKTCPGWCA